MRSLLMCTFLFSLPTTASAGAGVSPFIAAISPDALPAAVSRRYTFTNADVVLVVSEADARSSGWTALVSERDGTPVVGWFYRASLPSEAISIIEPQFLPTRVLAVADDALLQDLVDDAIDGPCGHEPTLDAVVQGDLIKRRVETAVGSSLDRADAVGVAARGLPGRGIVSVSRTVTGLDDVSIVLPSFVTGDGWCDANPTPHP